MSNFKSALTDCPHREKPGWLEVSHLLASSILHNYDGARFYQKICRDMRESQLDNGMVPGIAPEFTVFSGGIVACGLGDWCDVGPKGPGPSQLTSLGLASTAMLYNNLAILERTARVLGKPDEAAAFARRAAEVRQTFQRAFFHADKNNYDRNHLAGRDAGRQSRHVAEPLHAGARGGMAVPRLVAAILEAPHPNSHRSGHILKTALYPDCLLSASMTRSVMAWTKTS